MKRFAIAAAIAAALAGCQVQDPTAPGVVVGVHEAGRHLPEELLRFDDDSLRLPEVAWQVEVELEDGSRVFALTTGERRYAPGQRVRLLFDADGALLM